MRDRVVEDKDVEDVRHSSSDEHNGSTSLLFRFTHSHVLCMSLVDLQTLSVAVLESLLGPFLSVEQRRESGDDSVQRYSQRS